MINEERGIRNKERGKVILILLFCLFALLPLSAQTVKNIAVSGDNAYTDHISLEGDVTDKDIMVKFVFDEAANQLTVSLISHRMIFVFREDVRFKPLFKGRKLRPDQLPYVVTYDPTDKYMISKLFKSTVPKPRNKYVFHRWIDYEGLQPAPQEYSMVNDYISQTFDILKKRNSVVVRLRDVMLMNDVSKHLNKKRYEIPFGRDLYTEYHVTIQRNPCFGHEDDIASAQAALDGARKSYRNIRKRFANGTVGSEEGLAAFQELKELLMKQYPRKDVQSPCSDVQQSWDTYNMYADSISGLKCRLVSTGGDSRIISEGISARLLLSRARQIDTAVARWLLSADPIERRDIVLRMEELIKTVNTAVSTQGVYSAEQRKALSVFREAEQYYQKNCRRQ